MEDEYITIINSSEFNNNLPLHSIQIHSELIRMFANSSFQDGEDVRVISTLLNNVENLFPSGRFEKNK